MTKQLELGVVVELTEDIESSFSNVTDLGLRTCELQSWRPQILSKSLAAKVRRASQHTNVRVSSYWAGHSGKTVWNFTEGPATIGLIPEATRDTRVAELQKGADFANWIGVPLVTTHVGFIPENPADSRFDAVVEAIRKVAERCLEHGLLFCFETGQETPVTLRRTIEMVNTGNLGINLDPANLLLYGKANPLDALDVFGEFVVSMHAKDGEYPSSSNKLGEEKPLGEGRVDFAALIGRLKELGFSGPITIERETSGPEQIEDIRKAIELLTPLL